MKNTTPSGTRTFVDPQSVGPIRRADDFADRIRQFGDLLQADGDLLDPLAIEPQPVDCSIGKPVTGRRRQIALVRLGNSFFVLAQQLSRPPQPLVLHLARDCRQVHRRTLGVRRDVGAVLVEIELGCRGHG